MCHPGRDPMARDPHCGARLHLAPSFPTPREGMTVIAVKDRR
jgi:hypothetical protein